jgi:hypothetical protein
MKTYLLTFFLLGATCVALSVQAQGFVNLDFESANPSGYSPNSDNVPIGSALPGWSGFYGNNQINQVWYDAISTGGQMISVVDTNIGFSFFFPIQGKYSVYLFGGDSLSSTISQTALVPVGTTTLLFDAYNSGTPFIVTLGGQTVSMTPLQTFSNYTLYGADISSFAGQVATLSFTEPIAANTPPSVLKLDNIQFSTTAVPEPSVFALTALGSLLLGFRRWRNS